MLNISSPNCDLKILSASFFEIIVITNNNKDAMKGASLSSFKANSNQIKQISDNIYEYPLKKLSNAKMINWF